jgi:hypothetical protein
MTKEEALAFDLALEALEKLTDTEQTYEALDLGDKAITAIKQARSAPVQEPVAIHQVLLDGGWADCDATEMLRYAAYETRVVYTTPPAQPAPVPEGMKLVPVEPTQGMVKAFQDAMALEFGMRTTAGYHARVYSAMLTAAPEKGNTP